MKPCLGLLAGVMLLTGVLSSAVYAADGMAAGRLNVNTATKDELAWFLFRNGVGGPVQRAESIISYRQENGPFEDIEEIRKVEGIDEFEFERIRPWIKVQGPSDYRPERKEPQREPPYPSPTYPRDGPSRGNFPHDEPYGPWRIRP